MRYISHSVEDTICFAKEWAQSLKGGATILLSGDLGAGKTHFVKGVALALDIDDVITSPTFTLHNRYEGGRKVLNHFDCYRLTDWYEAEALGINEYFSEPNAVALIEWWQNVRALLPQCCTEVRITKGDNDDTRIIEIIDHKA